MTKPLFITFEGIDGCGKTTQINLLNEYLKNNKNDTFITLEPGGSDIGKNLRQILLHHEGFVDDMCELMLYLADRAQHVSSVILENLKQNKTVLCDRYTDSTVAYQGYARGGDIEKIILLNEIATKNTTPDLTFLFDIDVEQAQQRVGKNKDRLEKESLDFHQKVKDGYLALAKKYPNRIKVIDSSRTIDEIFADVKKYVNELI